jgi:hypothetical protein
VSSAKVVLIVAALIVCLSIPFLRSGQTAGGPTTASKVEQKFSLMTGQTVDIPVPVANKPVKILIGTLATSIPTLCHGNVLIGPGAIDGNIIKDAELGVTVSGSSRAQIILVASTIPDNPFPPSSAELQVITVPSLSNPASLTMQVFGFANKNCGSGPVVTHQISGVPVEVLVTFVW